MVGAAPFRHEGVGGACAAQQGILFVQAEEEEEEEEADARTSSLPGRARRRQRQWFACTAGVTGNDVPRVLFPSGVARPKMLDIMAGLVQMDSYSGIARLVLLVSLHLLLCFLPCLQARDARHHGRYGPEGMLRFAVQKTADVRSRSSSQVVDFLLRCRGLFPWSCCSADHRVSPVAPVHVVDVPVMQVVQLPRWFAVLGHADDMPVVAGSTAGRACPRLQLRNLPRCPLQSL